MGMTAGIVYYVTKKRSQLITSQHNTVTAEYSTFNPASGSNEPSADLFKGKHKIK